MNWHSQAPSLTTQVGSHANSHSSSTSSCTSNSANNQRKEKPKLAPGLSTIILGKSEAPYSLTEFQNFLKRTHCYENYEFLVELEEFMKIPDTDRVKRLQWLNILKCYIEVCSEYEINLTGDLKAKLLGNYDTISNDYSRDNEDSVKSLEIPSEPVLLEAKDETYFLLQDAYLQFLKSVENHDDNTKFVDKFNQYNAASLSRNPSIFSNASTSKNVAGNFGSSFCNLRGDAGKILIAGNYCLTTPITKRKSGKKQRNNCHVNVASSTLELPDISDRCPSPLSDSNSCSSVSRPGSMDLDLPGLADYLDSLGSLDMKNASSKPAGSTATTISAGEEADSKVHIYNDSISQNKATKSTIISSVSECSATQGFQTPAAKTLTKENSNKVVPRQFSNPDKKNLQKRKSFFMGRQSTFDNANEDNSKHKHGDFNWKKMGRKLKLF